jgi:hypothetical protein
MKICYSGYGQKIPATYTPQKIKKDKGKAASSAVKKTPKHRYQKWLNRSIEYKKKGKEQYRDEIAGQKMFKGLLVF